MPNERITAGSFVRLYEANLCLQQLNYLPAGNGDSCFRELLILRIFAGQRSALAGLPARLFLGGAA